MAKERGMLLAGWNPDKSYCDDDGNPIPRVEAPILTGKVCKSCTTRFPIEDFMVGGKARSTCKECRSS